MHSFTMQESLIPEHDGAATMGPMLRSEATGQLEPCDWATALQTFCHRFREAAGSAAWLASAGLTNEELGFAKALAQGGLNFRLGGPEAESESALSSASAASQILEECDVVVLFGDEAAAEISPIRQQLACNRHQPRVHVVGDGALQEIGYDLRHYRPRHGSYATLLDGIGNILIASGWIESAFIEEQTTGFADYARRIAPCSTDRVCEETGLQGEQVWELAEAIGTAHRAGFASAFDFKDSEPDLARSLENLALLRANLGGADSNAPFALSPANQLGARLFAGEHGAPHEFPVLEKAAAAGEVTALWLMATDGFCDPCLMQRTLALARKMNFVAVQASHPFEELTRVADLFLPSAGWRSKEGTILDLGGSIRLLKKREKAAGDALTDFRILQLIAQYWGCGAQFSRWSGPEAGFQILREENNVISGSGAQGSFGLQAAADYAALDGRRALQVRELDPQFPPRKGAFR